MGELESWNDFNVALAGATAALAGLVIVAASVNIGAIVKERSLTARLGAAVATLVLALLLSMTGLVPSIGPTVYGIVVLGTTAIATVFQAAAARSVFANHDPANRMRALKAIIGFAPLAAYGAGGVLLVSGSSAGLIPLAAGALLAIISGLLVSWVALVEVLR